MKTAAILALVLGGCTLVWIKGNTNHIEVPGGDVAIQPGVHTAPSERRILPDREPR